MKLQLFLFLFLFHHYHNKLYKLIQCMHLFLLLITFSSPFVKLHHTFLIGLQKLSYLYLLIFLYFVYYCYYHIFGQVTTSINYNYFEYILVNLIIFKYKIYEPLSIQ